MHHTLSMAPPSPSITRREAQIWWFAPLSAAAVYAAEQRFGFLNADYGDIKCDEYKGCGAGCMVEMPPSAPVPCDQVSTTR